MRQLLGLFAISFSYALLFATVSNIVIAREVDRLASTNQTTWVGVMMAVGALAQVITPIVGAWSDRVGSREPFLKAGTVLVVAGVAVLYVAATVSSMVVLFVSQLVVFVGLSVQYAMITVTLHDHVSDEQVGQGSAAMATLGILGAGCGYALFAVGTSVNVIYLTYGVVTIFCYFLTMSSINSAGTSAAAAAGAVGVVGGNGGMMTTTMSGGGGGGGASGGPCGCGSGANGGDSKGSRSATRFAEVLLHALAVPSPCAYPDFALACASRALFNAGLACQGYLVFFFRDVARIGTLPPEQVVSRMAVLALLGGLMGAVPAGIISDRWGKKPVIAVAAVGCICAIMSFPALTTRTQFDLIGLVFGVGNMAYLSVDYALGVQSLPRRLCADGTRKPVDAAKDIGIFALSATLGMLVGQLIFAGVLERFSVVKTKQGGELESHYAAAGFTLTFVISSVFFALSAVAAACIKTLK